LVKVYEENMSTEEMEVWMQQIVEKESKTVLDPIIYGLLFSLSSPGKKLNPEMYKLLETSYENINQKVLSEYFAKLWAEDKILPGIAVNIRPLPLNMKNQ